MEDGFEAAARAEVVRLRRKADELEAWLARYAGQGSSVLPLPRDSLGASSSVAAVGGADAALHPPASKKGRNAPLLKAIEAAGAVGLTVDEVHDAAYRAGLRPNRATIRSFLWNQRNSRRLVALEDGRHVLTKHAHPNEQAAHGDAATMEADDDRE